MVLTVCLHMIACVMSRYNRAEKLGRNVRVSDVVQLLEKRKGENLYVQAKFVVDTLNRYMSSANELITTAHTPERMMDKNGAFRPIEHSVRMVNSDAYYLATDGRICVRFVCNRYNFCGHPGLRMFLRLLEWDFGHS